MSTCWWSAVADPAFGTAAYFDRIAVEVGDDWDWRALHRVRLGWCLRMLARHGRPRYRRALDIGCGGGHFASLLTGRCDEVTGMDGTEADIAAARTRYPAVRFLQGRVESAEFPAGAFDLVTAVEMLYYLPPAALAEAHRRMVRWLGAGGDCLIVVRLKDTPHFHADRAEAVLPPGLEVMAKADLSLGMLHRVEAWCARAVRWARRRGLRAAVFPAEAACRSAGWLRVGAALLARAPGAAAAPTYRLWLVRKPA